MKPDLSVIIPVRNGARTIGKCLDALAASDCSGFEVIVVDDHSNDGSADIIRTHPCRLVRLDRHSGASGARNIGALFGRGETLFFVDADCLVQRNTLSRVREAIIREGRRAIIGGSYTVRPEDKDFYSRFQSLFVRYFETRTSRPDYIASHAMAVDARGFRRSGGFQEDVLPIIEDVELSHRLRRTGYRLVMDPMIEVRHMFGFSLCRSLRNAARKAAYWTMYSLRNRDLFADSGAASRELKTTVAAWCGAVFLSGLAILSPHPVLIAPAAALLAFITRLNRRLFTFFRREGGWSFGLAAAAYYALVYPAAVAAGAAAGGIMHLVCVAGNLFRSLSTTRDRTSARNDRAGAAT